MQHRAQGQGLAASAPPTETADTRLKTKQDDTKTISSPEPTSASSARLDSSPDVKAQQQGNKHRKRSTRQTEPLEQSTNSKVTTTPTTQSPRTGRSRAASRGSEEGRHSSSCQRQHAATSGKKTRCQCLTCQQERGATSPSQRPYRYGQFLGSSEAMPIYAGPLGLGDDIPSPTPSPPASGRLSIHMAMNGHSSMSSPSGSPLLSMSRPSLQISTGTRGRTGRRNHDGVSGVTSPHSPDDRLDSPGSAGSTSVSSHPVIVGFHNPTHDPKTRSSKKSPSRSTPQSFLEPRPLSPSLSSPSSPLYPSSPATSAFPLDSEIDTSPSLSPFLLSKRSFSPPGQMSPLDLVPLGSPPMRAVATHTYHILQTTKTSDDNDSGGNIKRTPVASPFRISNADFPRLAPPVVLVQSPSMELPESPSDVTCRILVQQQAVDHVPLLYSSVLGSSAGASSSNSPLSPRSPSLLPFSSGNQRGVAATPPLSPSQKAVSLSVLPSLDKKGIIIYMNL